MKVFNHGPAIDREGLKLEPGMNLVDAETWQQVQRSPANLFFAGLVANGTLVLVGA
jgi:hypothetical protein